MGSVTPGKVATNSPVRASSIRVPSAVVSPIRWTGHPFRVV
jgi:hypothetical protein